MERFLEVTVLTDRTTANRCCEALEDALIPLMLEHVAANENRRGTNGYRLLVPSQFTQRARRIADIAAGMIIPLTPRPTSSTANRV
jgi:hypothetical protein